MLVASMSMTGQFGDISDRILVFKTCDTGAIW